MAEPSGSGQTKQSTLLEDIKTSKKSNQYRNFKTKVLTYHTSELINETIQVSISEKRILFTDKSAAYIDIADFIKMQITEKSDKQTTTETLRWVLVIISNAKRNFLGNYHKKLKTNIYNFILISSFIN